jgi:2-(acetamidomethylene)succinate hydrolase
MPLEERLVDIGRISLNTRGAGAGPLVVLLHGITANAAVWDPIMAGLQHQFRVVAVDQRGHGKSDKPESGYAAEDYSRDLLALIETLQCGPAIVVGHSLGARNGLVAAAARPDLVRGVVAVDFTPFIEEEVFDALESRVLGGDRSFSSTDEIRDYLATRYVRMPADAIERRALHGYAMDGDVFVPRADPRAMAQTARGLRDDLEPATLQVQRPVLLVRGAESTLVSRQAFDRTARLRPDFTTLVVDDTDHYVPEEKPALIGRSVLEFAATLEYAPQTTNR